ncbi:hypothetical protein BGZ68_002817 [Mortierella alpina]|nr:hypothetical protein BGZ68_002817 [Mortierella alpina]
MATETVIYVSLALVLLTRIYVFISPPEFLEEHKDRRYHEYHLYRQYHLHKQYDDEPQENKDNGPIDSSRRSSTAQQQLDGNRDKTNPVDVLHHPSDELVLLGMGPGARPLPLHELSARALSELDPLNIVTSRSRSSSSSTAREKLGQDAWGDADMSMPNYLSLDTSEIHYNGSLKKFEQDPEVKEAIRELQTGQRDLAKECPTMTVVWEGGRWCCLEGRTLYILRSLGWQGQVRVQVLVDKDATMLAVTEEYWRAAGMISALNPLVTPSTDPITPTPISPLSSPSHQSESAVASAAAERATSHQVNTSAATTSAPTVGLSLEETEEGPGILGDAMETETRSRIPFDLLASGTKLTGTTAEQDETDGEMESRHEVESDGYLEDDEGDADEEDDADDEDDEALSGIGKRLRHASLQSPTDPYLRRKVFLNRTKTTAITQGVPPSPLLLPKTNESQTLSETGLHPGSLGLTPTHRHSQQQHHERKISIPEFLLPPPLHDEQVYLIIDPASSPTCRTPPRRDSGHSDGP